MDKSFHYMIMVNQSLFQKKVLDVLSPYKLTAGQPKVLDYLGKHNGCIQKSIAKMVPCSVIAGLQEINIPITLINPAWRSPVNGSPRMEKNTISLAIPPWQRVGRR